MSSIIFCAGNSVCFQQRTYTPWPVSCALPGAIALSERDGGCAPKPPHPRQKVTPATRLSLSGGANIRCW